MVGAGNQPAESTESLEDMELINRIVDDSAVGFFGYLKPSGGYDEAKSQSVIHEVRGDLVTKIPVEAAVAAALRVNYRDLKRGWPHCATAQAAIGFGRMQANIPVPITTQIRNDNRGLLDIALFRKRTVPHMYMDYGPDFRDFRHSDVIDGGKNEPAYRVGIVFRAGDPTGTRDFSGKTIVYLPESTALKLWDRIDKNPLFIGRVLESLFREKMRTYPELVDMTRGVLCHGGSTKNPFKVYIVPPSHDSKASYSTEEIPSELIREV